MVCRSHYLVTISTYYILNRIAKDILMSHSGPILMREEDDAGKLYKLPGRLVLWVWLGFDRFFPENFKWKYPPVLRGCGSVSSFSHSNCYSTK